MLHLVNWICFFMQHTKQHVQNPKIGVITWIFWNFSSQLKIRYLRQSLVEFLQQLNECSKNELILKLTDDFLASCYTSLTTKSSHLVWSITSWNLNQLKKKIVCWNQHEKFYLLIKFGENLRWWIDFSIFLVHLTWNDPKRTKFE